MYDWEFGKHPNLPTQVPANDGGVFKAFTNDETELGEVLLTWDPQIWKVEA